MKTNASGAMPGGSSQDERGGRSKQVTKEGGPIHSTPKERQAALIAEARAARTGQQARSEQG
jgi:hypothetical protein